MISRRGLALLLVLMVLVVSTTAALTMARQAATVSLSRTSSERLDFARQLAHGTRPMIEHWLAGDASSAVEKNDSGHPAVPISRDVLDTPLGRATVEVTAFDQLGMVPLQLARDIGATLSEELPQVREAPGPLGLDRITPPDTLDVFPRMPQSAPHTLFGDTPAPQESANDPRTLARDAVGQVFATHALTTEQRRSTATTWSLNINTAPLPLIESVLSRAGIDALDTIRDARSKGEPATAPVRSVDLGTSTVTLTARSTSWAIRTDVHVESIQYATWCVFVQRGRNWILEQSLVISE